MMNCPRCEVATLSVNYRTGIEVDTCPKCRGVWLDRGELDKIIERTELDKLAKREDREDSGLRVPKRREKNNADRDSDDSGRFGRRRSWFSDLFD